MAEPRNLLGNATSPYLLQHAANPVHWREWGPQALAEARETDRPILLSIGYAACHWCHVMAHESFEDAATAELMNRLFVNVKVDREERPDIDQLYMAALQALGEHGGWPMTMFLTPAGEPFWGGTYFPPTPRWGRPSFRQVLQEVADAYRTQREAVRHNVAALRQALATQAAARPGSGVGPATLDAAAGALLAATDPLAGGLRGAPKFPQVPIFRFLWQEAWRSGHDAGRAAVHLLLERMAQGGIYDHLGGGFARYATDAEWLVPHFEKMLYDNAQLLELLALAQAERPQPLYAERAEETVGWLDRDMTVPGEGGSAAFATAEDADSEGEEGKFYFWREPEIDAVLGADAAAFKAAYDVRADGNWQGRTILRRVSERGDAATEAVLAKARAALLVARSRRVRPARDDKVLADWNGLAIAGLCRAAAVFGRRQWRARAEAAFAFVLRHMTDGEGRVRHAWRAGRPGALGLLDDQAAMARAALALFEATGSSRYLDAARGFVAAADRWFADGSGAYFTTAADAADVPLADVVRLRSAADGPVPSGNGLMAEVLARLYHLTGEEMWRHKATALVAAFAGLGDGLAGCPTLLAAADLLEEGALVVVAGAPPGAGAQELLETALTFPDPAVCVLRSDGAATLAEGHPAAGKIPLGGGAAAFVCRRGTCSLPVTQPRDLAVLLQRRPIRPACRDQPEPEPSGGGASSSS